MFKFNMIIYKPGSAAKIWNLRNGFIRKSFLSQFSEVTGANDLKMDSEVELKPSIPRRDLMLNLPYYNKKLKPYDSRKKMLQWAPIFKKPEEIIHLTEAEKEALPYIVERNIFGRFSTVVKPKRGGTWKVTSLEGIKGDLDVCVYL